MFQSQKGESTLTYPGSASIVCLFHIGSWKPQHFYHHAKYVRLCHLTKERHTHGTNGVSYTGSSGKFEEEAVTGAEAL